MDGAGRGRVATLRISMVSVRQFMSFLLRTLRLHPRSTLFATSALAFLAVRPSIFNELGSSTSRNMSSDPQSWPKGKTEAEWKATLSSEQYRVSLSLSYRFPSQTRVPEIELVRSSPQLPRHSCISQRGLLHPVANSRVNRTSRFLKLTNYSNRSSATRGPKWPAAESTTSTTPSRASTSVLDAPSLCTTTHPSSTAGSSFVFPRTARR